MGTTLRIRGFLQVVPVRKEAAKKAASKTLTGIKKLLYNYAFARPSVRFAFRVLRTNNEKANWSYGPKIGSISLQDTTSKIAGQEVAAQCELRSAELEQTVPNSAIGESYYVDAVLVRPDGSKFSMVYVLALLTFVQTLIKPIASDIICRLTVGP